MVAVVTVFVALMIEEDNNCVPLFFVVSVIEIGLVVVSLDVVLDATAGEWVDTPLVLGLAALLLSTEDEEEDDVSSVRICSYCSI